MEIRLYHWSRLSAAERQALCRRAEAAAPAETVAAVAAILEAVRREGDAALRRYTRSLDGAELAGQPLRVPEEQLAESGDRLEPAVREALAFAVQNVQAYHETQRPRGMRLQEVRPGVFAGERFIPIDAVGLYVPRGRGRFPSVMYMLALPAHLAGVRRVACVSPPDREGRVDPATCYSAWLCGVRELYRIGGAQAMAALAYGTESIPKVEKILGPGSLYVSLARKALQDQVEVGLPAGPSEALILADESADPHRLCLDLITEAEHGADSSSFLVTPAGRLAEEVRRLLPELLSGLPGDRAGYVHAVLGGYGGIVLTEDMPQALQFVNAYAPEHLQIACREPFELLGEVRNAGEILLGQDSAFSMANYAVGCNNVLPTGGWAATRPPLSVRDFLKASSVVYVTPRGVEALTGPVSTLAAYEGFPAHALAVRRRGSGG
jgi:histidinol dehydrogenase